ncbi:MAG: YdeI/OmpD-associated family protein [Flavobacterium sp.]|nr:YdeI/OmpD-associated family protein [Flavobacterium sp.]
MIKTENFEQVEVKSVSELRDWLLQNHNQKESIWLVTYKKEVLDKYVSVQEVLDQLLCFAWIDGIRRKLDETRTMQLIAPRKVEHWAKTYKERFLKLEALALVHQAGFDSVTASKKAGLWDFMDDVDNLIVPNDLNQALSENKPALEFFEKLSPSNKRFVLRYIKLAKTEDTRKKRILQVVSLSAQNKKILGL